MGPERPHLHRTVANRDPTHQRASSTAGRLATLGRVGARPESADVAFALDAGAHSMASTEMGLSLPTAANSTATEITDLLDPDVGTARVDYGARLEGAP